MSTNFPNGLNSYGMPLMGGGLTLPKMGGQGKVFFVDPTSGSDSNSGKSPEAALDTVAAAYALCTDGAGDIVYLLNDGTTGGTARDIAIVWAKNNTHLIGLCAPSVNQRARIAPPTTDTADVDAYTPYITLSGSGCVFSNFSIYQGQSESSKTSVGIFLSGNRNYLWNVGILNGAHANQGDQATYNLQITGSENVIERSYIGVDTVARGGAVSANVRFGNSLGEMATRNIIRDCVLPMYADGTDPRFILTLTNNDTQRWNLFERCVCLNTGTSTLVAGITWSDASQARLFLKDCAFYGCTDVTAADSTYVYMNGAGISATQVDVGMFKGVDIS